jgi:pyruvate/2-oxoglutarate dehydrogenase complex dihydrolipoamide acyltransferase (E2) component
MEVELKLPSMGDMTDGTVSRWLKSVGDEVTEGEAVLEVETAKAEIEVEAPASGVLIRIVAEQGTTVDVGEVLAIIAPR